MSNVHSGGQGASHVRIPYGHRMPAGSDVSMRTWLIRTGRVVDSPILSGEGQRAMPIADAEREHHAGRVLLPAGPSALTDHPQATESEFPLSFLWLRGR